MSAWIIVSLILAIMVIILFFRVNRKNIEIAEEKKRGEREWTLKVALEKTFQLPMVDAHELADIEPELDRMINGPGTGEEVDEKVRLAVMELYAQKAEKAQKNKEE